MRTQRSRSVQSKRLGLENLEDRSLMAGNVTAAVTAGVLTITGDASDNGVTVDYIAATNSYQVSGTTQGGSNTTINSLDTSVPANVQNFTNVTKGIKIALNAGNDNLVFCAATSSTFVVTGGNLDIDMGLGNDTVAIGRNGNAAGGAAPIENEVNVSKSLVVALGGGNDTIDITNTTVAKNMVIYADPKNNPSVDGTDIVRFPTTFTPAGGVLTTFPVTVGGKTSVLLGAGADTFDGLNLISKNGMHVEDVGGSALTFDFVNSKVGGEFSLTRSSGASDIEIRNLNAGTLRLRGGNDVDTIAIRDSIFAKMYIATGAALDQITIGNTRVTKLGIIDGGRSETRVIQEAGNVLRKVVRIRTLR